MKSAVKKAAITLLCLAKGLFVQAQNPGNYISSESASWGWVVICGLLLILLFGALLYNYFKFKQLSANIKILAKPLDHTELFTNLNTHQIDAFLKTRPKPSDKKGNSGSTIKNSASLLLLMFVSTLARAEGSLGSSDSIFSQPGIIITIALLFLPVLLAVILIINKAADAIKERINEKKISQAKLLAEQLKSIDDEDLKQQLEQRKKALDFTLQNNELAGTGSAEDAKGIIHNVSDKHEVHFTALKKKGAPRPTLDPAITKLIIWYMGCAAFWLVIGTAIGEYVGIKFVVPDADHISWLSFGRLRPVHTNIVFWGWASLGIMGLGHYVVPTVSNTKLYSVKWGWIALVLTNLQVALGSISLMAGINNGGGEFREYI